MDTFDNDITEIPTDATRETRRLMVQLADHEIDDRTATVLRLAPEIRAAERGVEAQKEAAKAAVKACEAKVVTLRAEQDAACTAATTREEPREIEVHIVVDRKKRERLIVRGDTFQVIERRAAYPDEIDKGCEWVLDLPKGVSRFVHTASGFEVRTRLLEAAEKQLSIDALANREIVWIPEGRFTQLDDDDAEWLTCPVVRGTRLAWERSGEWMVAHVPVGATLDGLYHQLARLEFAFKVGNDAPVTVGDLTGRKASTSTSANTVSPIGARKTRAASKTTEG